MGLVRQSPIIGEQCCSCSTDACSCEVERSEQLCSGCAGGCLNVSPLITSVLDLDWAWQLHEKFLSDVET